jgi:methyltransferase (TIGR00027 family)
MPRVSWDGEIQHVSDTARLAAGWRSIESSRSDALFQDPLASSLAGEQGLQIARHLPDGAWVVAIRTVVIDAFLLSAISSGIDTIINVGAGLDTRPYRMDLPPSVRWFEFDHPSVIERKTALLRDETPRCALERWGLDLTDRGARRELFDRIGATSSRAMALTEGVIGYLDVDEVESLANDLYTMPSCELWVTEYFSKRLMRHYQRHQPMPSVPVRFDVTDWQGFFEGRGWRVKEIRYLGEESQRLRRPIPRTLIDSMLRVLSSRPLRDRGYAVLDRIPHEVGRPM